MNARAFGRVSFEQEIQCHINDVAEWVLLYDLSCGGAMIEVASGQIKVGDSVRLNLFDFATMSGRIAWKSERNAGVRFDSLLGDAIVRHLGFWSSSLGFDDCLPKDRLGQLIPDLPAAASDPGGNAQPDPDLPPPNWWEIASPSVNRREDERCETPHRREDRMAIDAKAELGGIAGQLADFSAHGCSFFDRTGAFQAGEEVWLRIGSLEPWKGTVRWTSEDRVGIEFERALHPAIFEHLAQSNPAAVCAKAV
jgi:PilZ domain